METATHNSQAIQHSETSDTTSSSTSPLQSESTLPSSPTSSTQSDLKHTTPELPGPFPGLPITSPPLAVSSQDAQTPDNWVARDDRMVRLTGKHPFNSEAKLEDLFSAASRSDIVQTLRTDFSLKPRDSLLQASSSMFVTTAQFHVWTKTPLEPGLCEYMGWSRTSAVSR